ncbi:MAG: MFS transporter, partial [Actinomycetes bacterium]
AMIIPSSLSLLNTQFHGRDRAIAFGIWGSAIGGMAAVGPLLGGWLATSFSWRWAFGVNLPLGLVILVGTRLFIAESRDDTRRQSADAVGTLALVLGLTTLVFSLIEGQQYGWWSATQMFSLGPLRLGTRGPSPVPVALATAGLVLWGFLGWERHRLDEGRGVLLDLRLFRIRSFSLGVVAAGIVSLGEFGLLFALPLFLQSVLGYSAVRTGALLVALAAGSFIAGPGAGLAARRFGARAVVRSGMVLEITGVVGVGLSIGTGISGWRLVPWLFVYGMGVGLSTAQLASIVLSDVPPAQSGQAAGLQSTMRQVGSALGIAVLGTVLIISIGLGTQHRLQEVPGLSAPMRAQIVAVVRSSTGAAIPSLATRPGSAPVVAAAEHALTAATRDVALLAAGFILVGLAATLALPAPAGVTGGRSGGHPGSSTDPGEPSATGGSPAVRGASGQADRQVDGQPA